MSLPGGTKQTIMVVDDSGELRELMATQLRFAGYDVVEAKDGREAVELACRSRPALILMDITMPVMDGVEATRAIRAVKELSRVVIVAFSALSSGNNRQHALEAGCDGYVGKNDGINRIPGIVQSYLSAA